MNVATGGMYDCDSHDSQTTEEELGGHARSHPPQQERYAENVSTEYHGVEQQPGVHDVVAVAELVDVPPALRYEDRVFEHFGGRRVDVSGEQHSIRRTARKQQEYTGPRTTLHIPSASATIPLHAALRRRLAATCATPKPSMHSPMAGSTEGCTATADQQKNVKRPRCLHLLRSTKSRAKSSVTGRIRNLAAYLSSEMRAASSTPTLCTEGWIKMMWNRA